MHNPRRQPVVAIAPDGKTTQYEWCLCGALQKLIDPMGRVTQWTWSIGGRNTEKVLPDGVTRTSYRYQPRSGRLASVTQPSEQASGGPTVTYRYGVDGRLKQEDYTDPVTPDVTYTYEAGNLGRLTQVVDGIGTHTFAYVPLTAGTAGAGALEYHDGPLTDDRIQYAYDWQDRVGTENLLADASATNLRAESYTWDTLGRLKTVQNTLGLYTYSYNTALPRVDMITGSNTLHSNFTYLPDTAGGESAGRLASITHLFNSVTQAQHFYGYDKGGRITSWEKHSSGQPAVRSTYRYNLGDELEQAEDVDVATGNLLDRETWGLDAAGNWLSHTRQATALTETRKVNSLNELLQIGGSGMTMITGAVNEYAKVSVNGQPADLRADTVAGGYRFQRAIPLAQGSNTIAITATDPQGETSTKKWQFNVPAVSRKFTYDANGNTLTDGVRTMTWDAKNRLRTVKKGERISKWDYDYRGRRVRECTDGICTKLFGWSEYATVQERDATNLSVRTHFGNGFSDGAQSVSGSKKQCLSDHLGNVDTVIAAVNGEVINHFAYTHYQRPIESDESGAAPTFLSIGKYHHHVDSDLEIACFRAYDAAAGLWMSRDPLGESSSLNLDAYNGGNPISNRDLLGLATNALGVSYSAGFFRNSLGFCAVNIILPWLESVGLASRGNSKLDLKFWFGWRRYHRGAWFNFYGKVSRGVEWCKRQFR